MTITMPFDRVAAGHWTTTAGPEWSNPGGELWGGYAIGACVRVLENEPEARGEALSLNLTYTAALSSGEVDVRTKRLRQGGSIGVWEVALHQKGAGQIAVHGVVTLARRPKTTPFAFAKMPAAPDPNSLPPLEIPGVMDRYGAQAFERRIVDGFPPAPGKSARSLAWVRARSGRFDKVLLAMVTDNSPPRVMYALGRNVDSTTLSLTAYLHATEQDLVEIGEDFVLIECDGQVGNDGASDERSNYWSRDGRLLATSTQLAWYRDASREMPE